MTKFKQITTLLLIAALIAPSLAGCLRDKPANVGETSGAGRYPTHVPSETDTGDKPVSPVDTDGTETTAPETNPAYTDAPETNPPQVEIPSVSTDFPDLPAASYTVENGKYVYQFEEPDRSGYNAAALNAMPKDLFVDCDPVKDPKGTWFFGKVKRDLATGEVTYVWDRWPDTLALLDKYGGIYRRHTEEKVCYLTFDCGYENGYTSPILDTLKEKNAPGIFFVTGDYVEEAGDIIRRMADEGHIIGNHTDHHYNATTITAEVFREEIENVEEKLETLCGYDRPVLYWRPPEGGSNEYVLAMSKAMGLRTVLWSYAYYDYDTANQMDYATALERAKSALHPGCVYLLHAVSSTNAAMLGELIDWIRAQGYEIRPLCD